MNDDGRIRIACVVEVALELSFEMISTSREAHKSLIIILKRRVPSSLPNRIPCMDMLNHMAMV